MEWYTVVAGLIMLIPIYYGYRQWLSNRDEHIRNCERSRLETLKEDEIDMELVYGNKRLNEWEG